jgi:hypothetical protein
MMVQAEDFVIVKLIPQARRSCKPVFYVGHVIRKMDDCWEIECLRKHGSQANQFIYPPVSDISLYPYSDIVAILNKPKDVHMVYHFSDDFSIYGSSLR